MTADFAAAYGVRGRAVLHAELERAEDECSSAGSHAEPVQVVSGREEISEVGDWRARIRSRAAEEPQEDSTAKG